ncbi:MAG: hypothetical protein JNM93_04900 [Bacteriovoracaceae bacterium]|nr:hypothetical protein [Bacteriovoracaceae bacterium]
MLRKILFLLMLITLQSVAHAVSGDIKCRVNQIQAAKGVYCEEKYTFPAICITLECLSKSKFVCRGNGPEFKVKFFYRYRQAKDQFNQYSIKPEFELKKTQFKPAEAAVELKSCD